MVFKRLYSLPNLCTSLYQFVLMFALDVVELPSKTGKLCTHTPLVAKQHAWIIHARNGIAEVIFADEVRIQTPDPLRLNCSNNTCPHAFMQCMHVCHLSFAKVASDGKAQGLASPLGAGRWRWWWSRLFLQMLSLFRLVGGPMAMCKPKSYLHSFRQLF